MKRIDVVYKKLQELSKTNGIDAKTLAEVLSLSRANVSSDLNRLCELGKAEKSNGRPVKYLAKEKLEKAHRTTLDRLLRDNKSLVTAGEQAKAAILYPPKGMHTLILGETGVGKTMFAGVMHRYGIEMGKMSLDAPFITFNCADYSSNPQLLISQLFGVKKGAYTGADTDRAGLIEKADGGILFLDEVHRLPSEGQEMFFTFMDKGIFRRLGETACDRKAKVLIISATTENPDSVLLRTFTRRIPMIIRLPDLMERGLEERLGLISSFFREESTRLDREILVSINSIRGFLSYCCPNNIGQLKADIQLVCAKAYADFVSNKKDTVKINSSELPQYIREGLYKEFDHRQIWSRLVSINDRYCIFNKEQDNLVLDKEDGKESVYDLIDFRASQLKSKGTDKEEFEKTVEKDIQNYFTGYLSNVSTRFNKSSLLNLVDPMVIKIVEEIVSHGERRLNRNLSQRVYLGLAIHIEALIQRLKLNKKIVNPQLHRIRTQYPEEFSTSIDCISIIENQFDISIPLDEAGFLTMFFVLDHQENSQTSKGIGVIILAHGESTASSMASFTNQLLGTNYAVGINASIDESPQTVLNKLREYIRSNCTQRGYILLVDMGSLTTFGEMIEQEFNTPVRVIPLVSTPHVIEATRKAILGYELEDIYNDALGIWNIRKEVEDENNGEKPSLTILTLCMTGEGSAIAIKNFLSNNLKYDSKVLEIIPVSIATKEKIEQKINTIGKNRDIICVVSPIKINTSLPQFPLDQVLSLRSIGEIQYLIDVQIAYVKMGETLKHHLKHVDGQMVYKDIKKVNFLIQQKLGIEIGVDRLIGITLHLGCMIDRLAGGEELIKYDNTVSLIERNHQIFDIISQCLDPLNKKYSIKITEDEICFLTDFFSAQSNI